jgi:hypothetical protein
VLVLGAPTEKFSVAELEALKKYVLGGGSLLVCMGEGGEKKHATNINYLLEQFGISVNADCVVRTVHYKYFHPKECLITDGVINREINTQVRNRGVEPPPPAAQECVACDRRRARALVIHIMGVRVLGQTSMM